MVKINKQLVSQSIINSKSYGKGNTKEYITIHETANTNTKADAQAHSNLQTNGNRRQASWHYQVDDKQIIQSFNDDIRCWHAGNNGNNKSIAIEICVNRDGDFKKAVDNAVALTKILMDKHNIPISRVKQHNYFTGKNCPTNLRNGSKGMNWNQFKARLSGKANKPKPTKKPSSKPKVNGNPNYKTNSLVDFLSSINQPFSFNDRKKLAEIYNVGRGKYSGKANENAELLKRVKNDYKANGKLVGKSNKLTLPNGVLRRGNKGYRVRQLQRALNKANYKVGKVDGIYGANTQDAVRRVQLMYEINKDYIDGIYGNRTRGYISKLI